MWKYTARKLLALVIALLSLTVCTCALAAAPALSGADYADRNNWLSFGGDGSAAVDVFAIYPTVTMSLEPEDRPYVRLESPLMRELAAGWVSENGALFDGSANLYAPLYRQLNGVELDDLNSDTFASYTNATPRDDIFAAFDYYLTHVNKGERPFILFGNSQGGQLCIELATTFLGSDAYARYNANHIATYAIGSSVTAEQVAVNPDLMFSQSPDDVGVIVSWNTTAPSEVSRGAYEGFGTWKSGALTTNPISWLSDGVHVQADQNLPSLVFGPDGAAQLVEHYADAQADLERGLLVVTSLDERQFESMSSKISKYHRYDIAFFYQSIRQNILGRISAFERTAQ